MKGKCKECGSRAINDHLHGREKGVDLNLCDVCYWRKRVKAAYIKGSNDCWDVLNNNKKEVRNV